MEMEYNKITVGFVIQTFKDGKPVDQVFICGDDVTYEDMNGEVIKHPYAPNEKDEPYLPFDMVQPSREEDC